MTDHDNDFDLDNQDEFESDVPAQGASLKDAWDNNPLMKIGAIVLVIAIAVGGYLTFFSGEEEENKSRVISASGRDVKVTVGGPEEADPAYIDALKKENERDLAVAAQTGGSTIPTPLSGSGSDEISIPKAPEAAADDPLAEWRQALDAQAIVKDDGLPDQTELPPEAPLTAIQRPTAPAPQAKMDPEAAKRLSEQMRVIIAAQVPGPARVITTTDLESEYVAMRAQVEKAGQSGNVGSGSFDGDSATPANAEVIVPAGNIAYGQLLNELNSDIRGPVLVQILSGPFTGGRALGQFTLQKEYLVLSFNAIVKDAVYYKINGIALDEKTTLTGQRSDVDRHYFSRVILPAAAQFISGYASAVAETGTTTTTTAGGGVVQDDPEPDATEEVYAGMEEAADKVAGILDKNSNRPITVKLHKGTTLGILFLESVTTEDVD